MCRRRGGGGRGGGGRRERQKLSTLIIQYLVRLRAFEGIEGGIMG